MTRTYGLVTKLTGAGGGGCAVTLVPEGEAIFIVRISALEFIGSADFPESSLSSLVANLRDKGYVPYLTQVGGPGLGILASHATALLPITPPEPATGDGEVEGVRNESETLVALFAQKPKSELGPWMDALGPWAHV